MPQNDMTSDCLDALAVLQIAHRLGSAASLFDYAAIAGAECSHQFQVLHLCDTILTICNATGFDLEALIDERRAQVLQPDELDGMA